MSHGGVCGGRVTTIGGSGSVIKWGCGRLSLEPLTVYRWVLCRFTVSIGISRLLVDGICGSAGEINHTDVALAQLWRNVRLFLHIYEPACKQICGSLSIRAILSTKLGLT
jgi:hypothetical protein